jgi:hypothetical protein
MKQETLKKIVELADGYHWEDGQVNDPANFIYTLDNLNPEYQKNIWELVDYPLLLRRAAEGWSCDNPQYEIIIGRTCLDIIDWDGKDNFQLNDYIQTDELTQQELAIEACLIELLEK